MIVGTKIAYRNSKYLRKSLVGVIETMKVFIIDSNDVRKNALEAQLANMGIMANSSTIHEANIIVSRNQDEMINIKEQYGATHTILLVSNDESDESIKEKINTKINAQYKDDKKNSLFPVVEDPHSKTILEFASKAAKSKASVLISGETGVGKELLARYIHHHSSFFNGPFISVNCGAMPDNMIEAILFGYEKGAFTNAINSYAGKFEQAQNGTLLLDEISEIPIGLQAKLLRVLQEREVERLCGKKIIPINVRVIAATNRDLGELVRSGLFRKDLYYRLNVLPIHCAALRDRALDIIPLAEYFIKLHAEALGRRPAVLTKEAKLKLMNYAWPGNIRELDNVIQRLLILTNNDVLDPADIHLGDSLNDSFGLVENHQSDSGLKINEAKMIVKVLKETDGCREIAAKKLKISPRTLRYKISKLKLIGWEVP